MKWTKHHRRPTEPGDIRDRHRFVWLPLTIKGETRWLETVRYREIARRVRVHVLETPGTFTTIRWIPECWIA